ncbi:MAG: GNAT family N-acetyltransferase [Candidatus Micrarchaeota archaeon]|nr:GNAT family N-acetyltransferase [Candidatus Micrarchaeota archaeon]
MPLTFKKVESIAEFIDAIRIRVDVFIKEQGFQPGWEPDEDDKIATQYIALLDGKIVATARTREIAPCEFKIERMAVQKEHRGKGIGKKLLSYTIEELNEVNPKRIFLRSQVQAQKFYEKYGFKPISTPLDSYGVQHIDMQLSVK